MKKIILSAAVLLFAGMLSAEAQIIQGSTYSTSSDYKAKSGIHYQGELNIGYGLGGKVKYDGGKEDANFSRAFFETVHGVRINPYAFAGVGVGFQYAYEDEWGAGMLPVFIDLKGYYPVTEDFAPYVAVDLGYSAGLFSDGNTPGGFYASYGVGLNYRKLNFGLGWQHQSFSEWDESINSFFVKVGFKF